MVAAGRCGKRRQTLAVAGDSVSAIGDCQDRRHHVSSSGDHQYGEKGKDAKRSAVSPAFGRDPGRRSLPADGQLKYRSDHRRHHGGDDLYLPSEDEAFLDHTGGGQRFDCHRGGLSGAECGQQ